MSDEPPAPTSQPCGPRPLPVVSGESPARPAPRASRMGWWRAGVLLGIHLLIAVHVAHWLSTGSTVSPLEPSESMEFAKEGIVNAGLIFFALTLGSTLVLGRFFCGWACHLVALQDAARWLLKRVGVTPRPLRSRVLVFVPLLAAIYMFGLPLAQRLYYTGTVAAQETHLQTAGFWDTFPSWPVSVATFVTCGFACVYLLGAKGFCTYACPYGGLFGVLEPLAPGRIRVSDACNSCGQCTSSCSSNVLVHAEVRDYGMVVDPGCMRCMDCVSVCPTNALSFGFGRPALGAKARQEPQKRKGLGWGEELTLVAVFAATFFAFRGLFGWVPFLFALGLAGCCAALGLKGVHLARRASVKLGGWSLKRKGALTGLGKLFVPGLVGLFGATLYAGAIQVFEWRAAALHQATVSIRTSWDEQLMRAAKGEALTPAEAEQVAEALAASQRVASWSLVETPRNQLRLAWLHLLAGDEQETEVALGKLLVALPDSANVQFDAGSYYAAHNRPDEAEVAYRRALELEPTASDGRYYALTQLLLSRNRVEQATDVLRAGIEHTDGFRLHHLLGELLAQTGDLEGAVGAFARALEAKPEHPEQLHFRLGNALTQLGRFAEGAEHYEAILALHPGDPRMRHAAGLAWADAKRPDKARPHLEALLPKEGFRDPELVRALADVMEQLGEAEEAAKLKAEWEAFRRGE